MATHCQFLSRLAIPRYCAGDGLPVRGWGRRRRSLQRICLFHFHAARWFDKRDRNPTRPCAMPTDTALSSTQRMYRASLWSGSQPSLCDWPCKSPPPRHMALRQRSVRDCLSVLLDLSCFLPNGGGRAVWRQQNPSHQCGTITPPERRRGLRELRQLPAPGRRGLRLRGEAQARNWER